MLESLKRIGGLLSIALFGAVMGFALGVSWTTNQALGLSKFNTAQTLQIAEETLQKQYQQLQILQQQLSNAREYINQLDSVPAVVPPTNPPVKSQVPVNKPNFTGEQLMQAVNKYRREHGVPELQLHSGLCQLSSRRLGELIDLGQLDNHAGFENYFDNNEIEDLSGPSLTNVAENLASGYPSAWDTVMGWDSSPPHRTFLLADGSYKYGCGSANLGFAVLIGGF
jgi:uncharacterized protein YkwD